MAPHCVNSGTLPTPKIWPQIQTDIPPEAFHVIAQQIYVFWTQSFLRVRIHRLCCRLGILYLLPTHIHIIRLNSISNYFWLPYSALRQFCGDHKGLTFLPCLCPILTWNDSEIFICDDCGSPCKLDIGKYTWRMSRLLTKKNPWAHKWSNLRLLTHTCTSWKTQKAGKHHGNKTKL